MLCEVCKNEVEFLPFAGEEEWNKQCPECHSLSPHRFVLSNAHAVFGNDLMGKSLLDTRTNFHQRYFKRGLWAKRWEEKGVKLYTTKDRISFPQFDLIISISIIDKVSQQNRKTYFEGICESLKPGGVCWLFIQPGVGSRPIDMMMRKICKAKNMIMTGSFQTGGFIISLPLEAEAVNG